MRKFFNTPLTVGGNFHCIWIVVLVTLNSGGSKILGGFSFVLAYKILSLKVHPNMLHTLISYLFTNGDFILMKFLKKKLFFLPK